MEVKTISSEITERIITEQQLLDIYNISLNEWEIEKKVINTWEVGSKTASGEIATTPLFQVKVWLKSKKEVKELEDIRKDFIEDIKKLSPKVELKKYEPAIDKPAHMLEIDIFDLHFGKLSWAEETGMDYDIKIATKLFNDCIDSFIEDTKHYHIEKILFPIGNDLLNSDRSYPYNSTTKGTAQTEDSRWQHTFRLCRQMLVENITKLSAIASVDVIMTPGNHDFERNFFLGDSLSGWFHNNPNININNGASPRKYYKYNNVLLGYTHGSEEPVNNLPMIMSHECPIEWGLTKYREFHLGHFHHQKHIKFQPTHENQGVMIRFISSLTPPDGWHNLKGFTTSTMSAEAYLWSRDKGLKSILYYNV